MVKTSTKTAPGITKDTPIRAKKAQDPVKKPIAKQTNAKQTNTKQTVKQPAKQTTKQSTKQSESLKNISNQKDNSKKIAKKDNKILEVKTTQTGALKQVIERISNFISDCCIVFIPPDDSCKNNDDDDYYEEIEEIDLKPSKKNIKKVSKKIDNDDDNDEEESKPQAKKSNNNTKKISKKIIDDDDDDDSDESNKLKNKKKSIKKSKKIVDDDDDETTQKASPTIKKNTGGIRILRLTEDKSILVKLNLDAINFEFFRCDEPKITIGVDMHNLHALLKTINDDDPIILYMNRDNRSALYIRSLNENNESCEETDIEIFLMEIGNPDMPIPQTEFQNKITMASDKFHTICKHLNNNSTFVEITSISNEILFRGQSEGGKVTMSYKDINYTSKKKDKPDQVVQGVYELRNLMGFSKCNKLCNTIEIYLKNDFPLVLVIAVATLGKMYVFLSPIENGNN